MVTSEELIKRIREMVSKKYKHLTLNLLGKDVLSKEELKQLKEMGIDTNKKESFLDLIYNHNFINKSSDKDKPKTVKEMIKQQSIPGILPKGDLHDFSKDDLKNNTKQLISKMKEDITTRIEGIIRDNNKEYKANALQNLSRESLADELVKEASLKNVKQKIKALSGDGTRDWQRIALTEMSNAIGAGSVDRIVSENQNKPLKDILVFRQPTLDAKTCVTCRRVYQDKRDNAPKLYRLSTLLANGTNMGRKTADWRAVVGSTHPNSRTGPAIELKPGYKLIEGGAVTYIGLDEWESYIKEKLEK